METKDKRKHVRHPVSIPTEIIVQCRRYNGFINDISEGGVFVEIGGLISIGKDISLIPETPMFGTEKRAGKIVRATTEGIGVKFKKYRDSE
jgi:hypothetical protein